MKGTDKQIAWATDILDNINKTFDAAEFLPASPAIKDRMHAMRTSINAAEYARGPKNADYPSKNALRIRACRARKLQNIKKAEEQEEN